MLSPDQMREEREYLDFIQREIDKHLDAFGSQADDLRRLTKEQREFIWDNRIDMDLKENYFEEATAMRSTESFGAAFNEYYRLKQMRDDPYFGRIDFREEGESQGEKIYIGTGSLVDPSTYDVYVYDWRSPIAGMYYDYEVGKASYHCELGEIQGDITLKRQYKVQNGQLTEVFDSSVTVLDEILQSILSADTQEKMRPVVTTIQKEQNAMIREEEAEILVIQGAAGSGKTSVALHRIAYLLYRRRNKLNEKNIVILSPNDYFSDYISGVLPELGEKNVRQLTFHRIVQQAFPGEIRLQDLASFMEQVYTGALTPRQLSDAQKKADPAFARYLENQVAGLLEKGPGFSDFADGEGMLIFSGKEMGEIFASQLPAFSVSQRLQKISTRFVQKMEEYKRKRMPFLRKALVEQNGVNYYLDAKDLEKDARLLWMQLYHGLTQRFKEHIQLDELTFYQKLLADFLGEEAAEEFLQNYREKKVLFYPDAAPLTYLKVLLGQIRPDSQVLHVVIDEAQDYNDIHYRLFARWFPNARFTILGDPFQLLSPLFFNSAQGFGFILDAFAGRRGKLAALNKRYRSTVQINAFADALVGVSDTQDYVERNGPQPQRLEVWDPADFVKQAFAQSGSQTCAVIVKTQKQAFALYDKLRGIPGITCVDNENTTRLGKQVILPSYLAKGLEFDQVIVCTDGFTPQDQKLLYICCTRALHRLTLISSED